MLWLGSIVSDGATGVGLLAGSIAVGGFLGHAYPLLAGKAERSVAIATVLGGVGGLAGAGFAITVALMR